MSEFQQTKADSLRDGSGAPLGRTVDPSCSTAGYKVYTGSLTNAGTPTVLDIVTDLGRDGTSMRILNTSTLSTTNFTVEVSYDGTNYGDAITIYPTFVSGFDVFISFKKLRLTKVTTNSTYDILVV